MRIDPLFVEAAIGKYFTKIDVENLRYALHGSYLGIVVKTFENTSEVITTKKIIFFKEFFRGF